MTYFPTPAFREKCQAELDDDRRKQVREAYLAVGKLLRDKITNSPNCDRYVIKTDHVSGIRDAVAKKIRMCGWRCETSADSTSADSYVVQPPPTSAEVVSECEDFIKALAQFGVTDADTKGSDFEIRFGEHPGVYLHINARMSQKHEAWLNVIVVGQDGTVLATYDEEEAFDARMGS